MLSQEIKEKLEGRFGYVVRSFGGIELFLNALNSKLGIVEYQGSTALELEVHRMLSHSDSVTVISPWKSNFKLYDDYNDSFSTNSIVFDEPYTVLNDKGKELYSVSEHEGNFGNSILDKVLLMQSSNGDMYYLHYLTYEGNYRTRLLIVNYASLVPITSSSNTITPVITPIEETQINQIVFNYLGNKDSNTYINVCFVPGVPARIPSKEAINKNPYAQKFTHSVANTSSIIFNPSKSGWLVLTRTRNDLEEFFKIKNIIGAGTDRLLPVNDEQYIYYVLIGAEVDVTTIRQTLRIRGLSTGTSASANVINLKANLEI